MNMEMLLWFYARVYFCARLYPGLYEMRCEKTCLRGFPPGPTQTELYSQRITRGLKFWI